jgi:uncharacterized protein HemX
MIDHTTEMERQVRTLRKRSVFTLFLTWLALFFTIIGIAAGYKNFLRVHDKSKAASDDAKVAMALMPQMASKLSIENWQREIRSQLMASQEQSTKELEELKALKSSTIYIETALKQQIEQLTRQQQLLNASKIHATGQLGSYWQISEIRYLLKIASRHLNLNHDSATAITALKAADAELMSLGLTGLLPIRNLIAKDIANLMEYQSVDLTKVFLAIDALADQLKPKIDEENSAEQSAELKTAEVLGGISDDANSILNQMKARLNDAVVIKRYDNKLAKTIKGDTQQVRYELIRLRLETLKLLALKPQYKVYQSQLKQLGELLKTEHIDLVDNFALVALAKLEALDLEPKIPTLLAEQLLDELLVADVTRVQP